MRVLFIIPPYDMESYPPLGVAYIASFLEKEGHKIKILDMTPLNMKIKEIPEEIKLFKPELIGISSLTPSIKKAEEIASLIKKNDKNIKIIFGGVHSSSRIEDMIKNKDIDFVVFGEGEITFLELIKFLEKGKNIFEKIDGLAFKKNDKITINKRRKLIQNLDDLPFPARHLLSIDKYKVIAPGLKYTKPTTTIITSRGCPNFCIFCDSHTVFERMFRFRSAKNIVNEIEEIINKYNITQFDIVDDTFTIHRQRVFDFCDLIEKKKLKIKYICNARVNTVSKEMMQRLKDTGCVRIDFGVESADPKVLKNIRKNITLDQVKKSFKEANEIGLKTLGFFMVGNPGDSKKSIDKTLKLIKEIKVDYPSFSLAIPFPGTELFKMAKKQNLIRTEDWDEYTTTRRKANQLPVMRTKELNYEEILNLYSYTLKELIKIKFKKNPPKFFIDQLVKIRNINDVKKMIEKTVKLIFS